MYFVVYFKFTNAKLILIIQDYILQNIIHFPSSLTFSLCFYHPSLSLSLALYSLCYICSGTV